MPMTFPAHQGLILPIVRRWPNSIDALALSVGAAMPDITDSLLGFPINGYFKQWYGHALVGIFTLDLIIGLLITWLLDMLARRLFRYRGVPRYLQAFFTESSPDSKVSAERNKIPLRRWGFSMLIGIFSHVAFDLPSHDTNLLLYPWREDPHWFPSWWYTIWFRIRPLHAFGRSYAVGAFSILWVLFSLIGTVLFFQFLKPKPSERP